MIGILGNWVYREKNREYYGDKRNRGGKIIGTTKFLDNDQR